MAGEVYDIRDLISMPSDADQSFDAGGYIVGPGSDGPDTVAKATGTDAFCGIVHHSTKDFGRHATEVLQGEEIAVAIHSVQDVLVEDGASYDVGDTVYMSATAGIGDKSSTSNTEVGTVVEHVDASDGDGTGTVEVPVNITGRV